jgi:hypothetical protein
LIDEEVEDAGFDAGRDAGPIPDSGFCQCDGGCCGSNRVCATPVVLPANDAGLTIFRCGPADTLCTSTCYSFQASGCLSGQCRCGAGPACGPGNLCVGNDAGVFSCVCNESSGCNGCCAGNTCLSPGVGSPQNSLQCGRASFKCDSCSNDGLAICAGGGCSGLKCGDGGSPAGASRTCKSGLTCAPVAWPLCEIPVSNLCNRCDALRTDRCSGTAAGGGACGDGGPCDGESFCDWKNGRCRPLTP